MKRKTSCCRQLLCLALALPLAWMIGLLLLWGVYSLPNEQPLRNAQESSYVFWQEETHRSWIEGGLPNVQVDNIADAYIIGMAANDLDLGHTPLERALNAYFPMIAGENWSSSTHLASYLSDPEQECDVYYYGRYWGGFALMARLWLYGFTFPQIRTINLVMQLITAAAACFFVWREAGWRGGIAVLIAYFTLSPYTISLSMQYYPCFYLGFGGMIAVAVLHRRKAGETACQWLFLILGILTAYLDFLTYPSAVVGLPLAVWLLLRRREKPVFWPMLRLGLIWCMGYAGMWAGKWLLCMLAGMSFTGGTAAGRLSLYTGDNGHTLLDILSVPFRAISKRRLALLSLPSVAAVLWGAVQARRGRAELNLRALWFALIMFIPLVWVAFTRTHSLIHDFLSNRNLTVFFAAAFLLAGTAFTQKQSKENDHGTASRLQSGEN